MSKHKIIAAVLLLAMFQPMVRAISTSDKDKPAIPTDLYYEFKAVPAEDNAIVDWRRAGELVADMDYRLKSVSQYCWTIGAPSPSEDDLNQLRGWLGRNKEALKLFNASLDKPKAQWFEIDPRSKQPELKAFTYLICARLFEVDELASQKKYKEAVESLEGSLRLTQIAAEADAALTHYSIARRARMQVQNAMIRLAGRSDFPSALTVRLLKDVPENNTEPDFYSRVLRAEFTRYAYHPMDLATLAERLSKTSEASTRITNVAAKSFIEKDRRTLRVLTDPSLVSQHPDPYDQVQAIRSSIFHFRIAITNVHSLWMNRSHDGDRVRMAAGRAVKNEIEPLMELLKDEPLPLSKQASQKALNSYLQIENPVGLYLEAYPLDALDGSEYLVFQYRVELSAVRTLLGVMIFEKETGHLPGQLSDVIEEKILPSIPVDPYADSPMRYARTRGIIWSVGLDGYNDDGASDDDGHPDLVWKIPKNN